MYNVLTITRSLYFYSKIHKWCKYHNELFMGHLKLNRVDVAPVIRTSLGITYNVLTSGMFL